MIHKDYLNSKIAVPKVLHELLPRNNIADIIDNAPLDQAVCFIAPYGCGKTLSIISWLNKHNRNAAWITLDETDNSETMFFADLSAAIMRLAGWQGNANDILSDPLYKEEPQTFLQNAILNAEKTDKILVLDGFRFIKDGELLVSIKNMFFQLLGNWRIIIAGRIELPSVFNDLILKRNICLVTLKELSYNTEEIKKFFAINGYTITHQEAVKINKDTEGWPASLNVILTLSRGGPVSYGEAAREYVTGFFETEIWGDLDQNVKDFLLKTSILDKLTPAACNAVTDIGATLPILRRLFVNGLFISRLNERESYRYHRVFQDFLRYKLNSSGIDERKLHNKIAWWMFEKEKYEQAFPYFFKAGDLYGMSRVFRIINSADIGLEKYLELTSCITTLKIEELREYPLIVAKIALVHYALGNISEMQRLYDIFTEWIKPGVISLSPEEYAECVWEAGWLSYINPAEPILNNEKHQEWFNYMEYDPHLKLLHHNRSAVYRFPSILRGIRDYCPVLNTLNEQAYQNEDKTHEIAGEGASLLILDIVRAEYAYELENFALSEKLIRKIMIDVERQQLTDLYFVCTALLVKIIRAIYDPKEIDILTIHLETMIKKTGHAFLLPRFHAFELRNKLADEFIGQTKIFEKENKDYMEKSYFHLFYRHITLVRALISTCSYNQAILILGNLEYLCHQYSRIMDLIEVNILKAVAYYALGDEDSACRYLTEALDRAREYGFIRIFSDEAKDIWPILNLAGMEISDDYAENIMISCKKTLMRAGIKFSRKNRIQSELTKTELKILKTLDLGMSYKEMALDNSIKVSTVKTHIQSIYSKLDVSNRTAAVIAAKNKGIID